MADGRSDQVKGRVKQVAGDDVVAFEEESE